MRMREVGIVRVMVGWCAVRCGEDMRHGGGGVMWWRCRDRQTDSHRVTTVWEGCVAVDERRVMLQYHVGRDG